MFNLWENSKVALYFEDTETDGFVSQTISEVKQDPAEEELEQFVNAVNGLSDLEMDHFKVTQTQRYVL